MWRKWQVTPLAVVAVTVLLACSAGLVVSSSRGSFSMRLASLLGGMATFLAVPYGAMARWRGARLADRKLLQLHVDGTNRRGQMPTVREDTPAWPEIHKSFPLESFPLELLPGTRALDQRLPTYVARDVDPEVYRAIDRGGLIILEGPSASGLSRIAYEAIKWKCLTWTMVSPANASSSLPEVAGILGRMHNVVIYVNSLEEYVTQGGLTTAVLNTLSPEPGRTDIVIVAVFTPKDGTNERLAEVRNKATAEIRVLRDFSEAENGRARLAARTDPRIAKAAYQRSEPFTQYLASGEAALDHLQLARDGRLNLTGVAIIFSAIKCRRLGMNLPLTRGLLYELHLSYLESPRNAQSFEEGLEWAMREILGRAACLRPVGDEVYEALPYLVEHAELPPGSPPGAFSEKLLDHLPKQEASAGGLDIAEMCRRLSCQPDDAEAVYLHGHLLLKAGRPHEALQRFTAASSGVIAGAAYQAALLYLHEGDRKSAESWFRYAARSIGSHHDAQFQIGALLYADGQSGHSQRIEAETWLRFAVRNGHVRAQNLLDQINAASRLHARSASIVGDPTGMNDHGVFLAGIGRESEAAALFRSAASRGSCAAAENIANNPQLIKYPRDSSYPNAYASGRPAIANLDKAKKQFVVPFFLDVLQGAGIHPERPAAERQEILDRMRAVAPSITLEIAMSLWAEGPAERTMASWWATVWRWPEVPDQVQLLMPSRSPFEGQTHCLALARTKSPRSRAVLMHYLTENPSRQDLPHRYHGDDQTWAMAALMLSLADAGETLPKSNLVTSQRWSNATPHTNLGAYIDTLNSMKDLADSVAKC
jgi:tetratricopeptide (TPR) repeat protein